VFSSITSLIYRQKTRNTKHLYLDTQYGEIDLYNSNLLSISDGFTDFVESEDVKNIVKAMKTRLNDNDIKVLELRLRGYKATECEKALNLTRSKVRTSLKHIATAYNSVINE
jgi:serine/threonine protein phosphatase PrpC